MYERGEKVLFLPLAPARRGDYGARFDYGIHVGYRSFNGQAHSGTPSGVIRCRRCDSSVMRKGGTENSC